MLVTRRGRERARSIGRHRVGRRRRGRRGPDPTRRHGRRRHVPRPRRCRRGDGHVPQAGGHDRSRAPPPDRVGRRRRTVRLDVPIAERRGFGSRSPPSRSRSRALEGSEGSPRGPHRVLPSSSARGSRPEGSDRVARSDRTRVVASSKSRGAGLRSTSGSVAFDQTPNTQSPST
jgi:hypothetical protein